MKKIPKKYRLFSTIAITALVFAIASVFASSIPLKAEEGNDANPDVDLSVELLLDEAAAQEEMSYTFEIAAKEEAPLPSETTLKFDKAGTKSFPTFTIEEPGDYYYTVKQTTKKTPGFTLDETIYNVRVNVYLDNADLVQHVVIISKEGGEGKSEKIQFENKYEQPLGKLLITKELVNKEQVAGRIDPATFVFKVDVTFEDETVLSNVYSVTFTEPGTKDVIEIEDLPVGAEATVEEVYSGVNYSYDHRSETKIIGGDDPEKVEDEIVFEFSNTHTGTWNGGGSATNHIGADGSRTGYELSDDSGIK